MLNWLKDSIQNCNHDVKVLVSLDKILTYKMLLGVWSKKFQKGKF